MLVTVTSAEAERVVAGLVRAGVPQARVRVEPAPRVTLERILPHLTGHGELRRLAAKPEAAELLTRLKVADVLVTNVERLRATDADAIVGEATMAEWFWSGTVESAPNRTQRSAFLKRLATRLADEARSTMPDDEIGGDEAVAHEFVGAGILARSSGRLGFEHDLLGEWARYHVLVAKRDRLSQFLKPRRGQVTWHGAVRLLGSKRVERPTAPADWRALLAELEDDGAPSVHGDLLLEALGQIWGTRPPPFAGADELLADEGRLLVRLLNRVPVSGSSAAEGLHVRVPRFALWVGPTRYRCDLDASVKRLASSSPSGSRGHRRNGRSRGRPPPRFECSHCCTGASEATATMNGTCRASAPGRCTRPACGGSRPIPRRQAKSCSPSPSGVTRLPATPTEP